jgi:hypothetical protein
LREKRNVSFRKIKKVMLGEQKWQNKNKNCNGLRKYLPGETVFFWVFSIGFASLIRYGVRIYFSRFCMNKMIMSRTILMFDEYGMMQSAGVR